MKISVSPRFKRQYRKLPTYLQDQVDERQQVFCRDPFSPILKTHKLGGKYSGLWSFSVDFSHRIIFQFMTNDRVRFHSVGNHSIYKG